MSTNSPADQSIEEKLTILHDDIIRKSRDTQITYECISRKFLTECNDFSRRGMLKWLNNCPLSANWHRTAHYALARLCKALEIKFPLDGDDLFAIPDEDSLVNPTMEPDDMRQLIATWKLIPHDYTTSLVFISTIFGKRSCEMSSTQGVTITKKSIIFHIAKRKALVTREHAIPEQYMRYLYGFEELSERNVRYRFITAMHRAGIERQPMQSWHSIRRGLETAFHDKGIDEALYKRFTGWAPDRKDMASVYTHHPFEQVNGIILGQIPELKNHTIVEHPFLKEWD